MANKMIFNKYKGSFSIIIPLSCKLGKLFKILTIRIDTCNDIVFMGLDLTLLLYVLCKPKFYFSLYLKHVYLTKNSFWTYQQSVLLVCMSSLKQKLYKARVLFVAGHYHEKESSMNRPGVQPQFYSSLSQLTVVK